MKFNIKVTLFNCNAIHNVKIAYTFNLESDILTYFDAF